MTDKALSQAMTISATIIVIGRFSKVNSDFMGEPIQKFMFRFYADCPLASSD